MPGDTKFDRGLWKLRAVVTGAALALAGLVYLVAHVLRH